MPEKTTAKTSTKKSEASKEAPAKNTTKKSEASSSTTTKKTESKKASGFQGDFIPALGRRKKSVAQVRIYTKGSGKMVVNDKDLEEYCNEDSVYVVNQPLKLTGLQKNLDVSVLVKGGGIQGQAEAVRLGISRALIKYDQELTHTLRAKAWLTRDPRRKERKKPGLKKARRAPQWSKR